MQLPATLSEVVSEGRSAARSGVMGKAAGEHPSHIDVTVGSSNVAQTLVVAVVGLAACASSAEGGRGP